MRCSGGHEAQFSWFPAMPLVAPLNAAVRLTSNEHAIEHMKRVMWIEYKGGGIVGPARIGWVELRDKEKRLTYRDQSFRSLKGGGFKSNYYDTESREEYWITGCRKDGQNALYCTRVEIDEDALEEYWVNIRKEPEKKHIKEFHAEGKNRS